MSSDRRPAKVRVVSSEAAAEGDVALAPAPGTPARRRGDRPQEDASADAGTGAATAPAETSPQGGSIAWALGAIVLFLIGCAVGGGLLMLSGLVSATDL